MEKVVSKESLSCFDSLYHGVISRLFNRMEDSRAENASYSMSDALKSGFAIFSLKCASLFSFRKRSQTEDSNLATVYGIGGIPTDNALRNILDKAKPDKLRLSRAAPLLFYLNLTF